MAGRVDLGSVYAKLVMDTSQFERGVDAARKSMGSLDKGARDTQKSFGTMFKASALGNLAAIGMSKGIQTLVGSVGGAISRVDTLNNSTRTFNNMGFNDSQITGAMDNINKSILGLPTTLDDAVRNVTLLASSTQDLDKSQKVFAALNNGILGFGGNSEMVNNAIVQLSQGFAGGKITGQEWLSMLNSGLGPALNAMAKDMGITTAELKDGLSKGKISVEQFQDSLIKLNTKGGGGLKSLEQIAADSTAGIQTGMTNARTAITRGVANMLQAFGPEKISGAISGFGNAVNTGMKAVARFITAIMPTVEKFGQFMVNNFDTIKAVLAGIAVGIGVFAASMAAIQFTGFITGLISTIKYMFAFVKAFGLVQSAMAIGLAPITLIVAGIALLGAALVAIQMKFGTFSGILDGVKSVLSSVWNAIKLLISGDFKGGIFGLAEDSAVIDYLFKFRDVLVGIGNFVKDNLLSAFDSLKSIWSQLVESMQPLIDMFRSFWEEHGSKVMTVLKYIGIAIAGIAIAPLAAAFGLLIGAVKILSVVLGFIANNFDLIKNIVLIVMGVAFAPLIGLIALVVAAFKFLPPVLQFIWSVMQSVWNGIVTAWNAIYATVSTVVSGILNVVTTVFTAIWTVISTILTTVWNVISTIATAWWSMFKFWLELIKNIFIIVFGSILIVILTVLQAIWGVIQTVWNAVYGFISSVLQRIWSGMQNIWNAILNVIKTVWNAIWGFLSPIIQKIVSFFVTRFNNLKTNITNIFNAVKSFISNTWNTIYGIIKGIVQRIINFFAPALTWLLDKGKALMTGLIDGIKAMFGKITSAVTGAKDKAVDFFKKAGTWLYDSGKALISGFVNGIKAMGDKAKEAAKGVMDKVRSFFPSSPAKEGPFSGRGWTKYSGQALMKGFSQGVQMASGDVSSAMNDVLGKASGTLNADITATTKPSSAIAGGSVSIYGDINVKDKNDVDYLMQRLSRKQDLTLDGLVGV